MEKSFEQTDVLKGREIIRGFVFWSGCFFVPILIYCSILYFSGIYPFGTTSNLTRDLHIQYADLLSYLWNVLHGQAKLSYTFSKSLGGSAIGTFAYYLASPINLLLYFFEKNDIQLFVYVAISIKLGLSSLFQALFLKRRFPGLKCIFVFTLSICYALSFYNLHQMDNVMWLDGVYMLPLVMYGVWQLVSNSKNRLLVVSVCCTILFNWYIAYMVCLFAGVYFCYEILLRQNETLKTKFRKFFLFVRDMILGVMLSSVLFLPTIYALRQGKGNIAGDLFNIKFNGTFVQLLRGFVGGNDIGDNNLSIFCGVLVTLTVIIYFVFCIVRKRWQEFFVSSCFLGFMLASFMFRPLENVWNGMRIAESYFCRFSFLQTWLMIILAAKGLEIYRKSDYIIFLICDMILAGCLIGLNYIEPFLYKPGFYTGITVLAIAAVVFLYCGSIILNAFLVIVVSAELFVGGLSVVDYLYWDEANKYKEYVDKQQLQITNIQDDSLFYRVEQTWNRGMDSTKCTAYFDESLAYDYRGFSHYTSTFNENLRKFGENLGYGNNDTITMYNEPILSSDSLLGIKYIMAEQQFPGLQKQSEELINGKEIYRNPYALPLGFQVSDNCKNIIREKNNFEFQNLIFSAITGNPSRLFEPVEYDMIAQDGAIEYRIPSDINEDIVYGYADCSIRDVEVYVDGNYRCNYERWLSYRVLNVGFSSAQHTVLFQHPELNDDSQISPVFYRLNMPIFQEMIAMIKKHSLNLLAFEDGYVKGNIESEVDGYVLLTIPNEKGWTARVNDSRVDIETGCNTLMMIPVNKGRNTIEVTYKIPYLMEGFVLSVTACLVCICISYWKKRRE